MGVVKFGKHGGVQDDIAADPGAIFRAMLIPVDQVLQSTSLAPGVNDVVDSIDRTLVLQEERQRGFHSSTWFWMSKAKAQRILWS